MNDAAAQQWPSTKVRDWLLAVLRYALTLEQADRDAVLATARALDHCGGVAVSFSFFAKTSVELCDAIADNNDPNRSAILKRHLARIEDHRLRRAFEAAVDWTRVAKTVSKSGPYQCNELWKGLAPSPDSRPPKPL
jgi:hypothetical protein